MTGSMLITAFLASLLLMGPWGRSSDRSGGVAQVQAAEGGADSLRTAFLTDCTPYSAWQSVVMAFSFRQAPRSTDGHAPPCTVECAVSTMKTKPCSLWSKMSQVHALNTLPTLPGRHGSPARSAGSCVAPRRRSSTSQRTSSRCEPPYLSPRDED